MGSTTHLLVVTSLPAAAAIVMMRIGMSLRLLHPKHARRCPSCGRFARGGRCRNCEQI